MRPEGREPLPDKAGESTLRSRSGGQNENLVVKLRGTKEDLDQIAPENIRAVADLNDYNTSVGEFMIPADITVDGSLNVGAFGEYTVSVRIRKD